MIKIILIFLVRYVSSWKESNYQSDSTLEKGYPSLYYTIILLSILLLLSIPAIIFSVKAYLSRKNETNITKFWDSIKKVTFNDLVNLIYDKKYKPKEKRSKRKWNFIYESGFLTPDYENVKDETYNIPGKSGNLIINIHKYILTDREYHICENPLKSQTEFFWDEILERKICYILSFCSYIPNSTNGQYNDCWSLSSKSIGDYFIENISSGTVEEMNMRYIEYCFSNKSKSTTHTVKIFQCSEWKINDIPQSITCFINLYSFLCNEIKENSLLVHSLYLPDSRVSVFISFAYIVESMLNNENTNDPMKIVKISKDQGHCGPLTKIDFAFLLRSVIEYFVKRNKLYIGRNMKIFNENYNNFIKKTHGKFIINDKKFYHFFNYANTLTKEKIRSYCGIENKICLFEEEDMKRKCSKFYKILNFQNKEKEFNPTSARKAIRYDNIPCFDEYLACYYRRNIDINDLVDNFVHANELAYLHINDIIRRIIICQTPMSNSINSYFAMIYNKNIDFIINMDETPSPFNNNSYRENESIQLCDIANSFHDYFPEDDEEKIYGKFIIKKCSKMRLLGNQIEWTEYSMEKNTNSNNKIIKFKVFKFFSHISTKEDDNNISYNILCETILKNSPNASILLQDPFGISTSAVMALIIMMIDNIPLYHYFDPVSYFIALREIRLNAIMYDYHFLFAILVVVRYYEDKISFLEEGLIEKLTKYIKNEMNHFKNLDKELSRL